MEDKKEYTKDGWEIQYIDPQEVIKQQLQAKINVMKGLKTPAIGYTEELTMKEIIDKYGSINLNEKK